MSPRNLFLCLTILGTLGTFAAPSVAEAKCFAFRGLDLRVCVDGDGNASRRTAVDVCERVSSESCSVSGYSGSCRTSGDTHCYDSTGTEQRSIESD